MSKKAQAKFTLSALIFYNGPTLPEKGLFISSRKNGTIQRVYVKNGTEEEYNSRVREINGYINNQNHPNQAYEGWVVDHISISINTGSSTFTYNGSEIRDGDLFF